MGGLAPHHYPPGSEQEREWLVSEHARLTAEVERQRLEIAGMGATLREWRPYVQPELAKVEAIIKDALTHAAVEEETG